VSAKTKVEAWAVVDSGLGVICYCDDGETARDVAATEGGKAVRLVPYDAKKEAVVRAAKAWFNQRGSAAGPDHPIVINLERAIEALFPQQPKKRRCK